MHSHNDQPRIDQCRHNCYQLIAVRSGDGTRAMLVDDRRGNCDWDNTEISRTEAGQITTGPAARLPWVASPYP
jgi:hypothetical protein